MNTSDDIKEAAPVVVYENKCFEINETVSDTVIELDSKSKRVTFDLTVKTHHLENVDKEQERALDTDEEDEIEDESLFFKLIGLFKSTFFSALNKVGVLILNIHPNCCYLFLLFIT
jgi:hypothetical protein